MVRQELNYLEELHSMMDGKLAPKDIAAHVEHLKQRIIQIDTFIEGAGESPTGAMGKICKQFSERKAFFERFIEWAEKA